MASVRRDINLPPPPIFCAIECSLALRTPLAYILVAYITGLGLKDYVLGLPDETIAAPEVVVE